MEGLAPGDEVTKEQALQLICYTGSADEVVGVEWLVNNKRSLYDRRLVKKGDSFASIWCYVPQLGDYILECRVKRKEGQESSDFAFFNVRPNEEISYRDTSRNKAISKKVAISLLFASVHITMAFGEIKQ